VGFSSVKVFIPIDHDRLHGPDGNTYLANFLTEFRTCYYTAKENGTKFYKRSPLLVHVGIHSHSDQSKIQELIRQVRPESKKIYEVPINEQLIESLYRKK